MRRKPAGVKVKACIAQLGQHVIKVLVDPVRQHEPVVQLGAPAGHGRGVRCFPKSGDQRSQQQLLHDAHAGMRRHLESAQLQQTQPPGAAVG